MDLYLLGFYIHDISIIQKKNCVYNVYQLFNFKLKCLCFVGGCMRNVLSRHHQELQSLLFLILRQSRTFSYQDPSHVYIRLLYLSNRFYGCLIVVQNFSAIPYWFLILPRFVALYLGGSCTAQQSISGKIQGCIRPVSCLVPSSYSMLLILSIIDKLCVIYHSKFNHT